MPERNTRQPRAIVCDDDAKYLGIFKHHLGQMGYEVLTAETPMTCAFYRDHADSCPQHNRCTDVLITDYMMPGMTGLELLEMQHRSGCKLTSRNKALMMESENMEIRKRAEAIGCHFFPKPLLISTLIAWIKECESRTDLAEPLAEDLFLPSSNRSIDR